MEAELVYAIKLRNNFHVSLSETPGGLWKVDLPDTVHRADLDSIRGHVRNCAGDGKVFFSKNNHYCHVLPLVWESGAVAHFDNHSDTYLEKADGPGYYANIEENVEFYNHVGFVAEETKVFHINKHGGRFHCLYMEPVSGTHLGRRKISLKDVCFDGHQELQEYMTNKHEGPWHVHVDPDGFADGPENDWGHGVMKLQDLSGVLAGLGVQRLSASLSDMAYLEDVATHSGMHPTSKAF